MFCTDSSLSDSVLRSVTGFLLKLVRYDDSRSFFLFNAVSLPYKLFSVISSSCTLVDLPLAVGKLFKFLLLLFRLIVVASV